MKISRKSTNTGTRHALVAAGLLPSIVAGNALVAMFVPSAGAWGWAQLFASMQLGPFVGALFRPWDIFYPGLVLCAAALWGAIAARTKAGTIALGSIAILCWYCSAIVWLILIG